MRPSHRRSRTTCDASKRLTTTGAQVISSALADERLTFDHYRRVEHPYVEQWWGRHWDLADRLLDDPDYDQVRVNVFDAEDLAYRYVVTAVEDGVGTVVLIEFRLVD